MSLIEDFETALDENSVTGEFSIESRSCTNGTYNGVEYNFYGYFVPLRPIIEVVDDAENRAICNMGFVNEGEEPRICVFVAHVEKPNPTFTP